MNYKFFVPFTLTLMIESTRRLNSPFYMALVQQQKIITVGSRISLNLTVHKKRCVQKNVNVNIKRFILTYIRYSPKLKELWLY